MAGSFHTTFFGWAQYGWMGVDIFFVISGVVMSLVTEGKFQSRPHALRFLSNRFVRIYPVFWFYYFIVLGAYLYNPLWINASAGHHAELLRSFLLIPSRHGNLIGQAWTLSYELNFYILFFLFLLFIPERHVPIALATWGGGIGLIAYSHLIPPNWYTAWVTTNPFIWEFLAGCFVFQIYKRAFPRPRSIILLASMSALLFAAVVWQTNQFHAGDSSWLRVAYIQRPLLCGIISAPVLLCVMLLEKSAPLPFFRPMSWLGDWSYSIYLSHEIIVEASARLVHNASPAIPAAALVVAVIALPAVVLFGYLSYTLVERPILTYLHALGPRQKKPTRADLIGAGCGV